MIEILRSGLAELGLNPGKAQKLELFARLVLERNKVMNLTAITEEADFARLHLLDSASLLKLIDFHGKNVIDVGTGAGFPGVPLRILCEDAAFTLLDSTGKRIEFLREASAVLSLSPLECIQGRAEEFAAKHRETFDLAVSRAVAALPVLCELCLPLVKTGGSFLAMKSAKSDEEIENASNAIDTLGGRLDRVVDYRIPTCNITHRVLVIRKERPTPIKYPRAFGQMKKKPL